MTPMKICIISEYFPPRIIGGGEHSAYLYARGLAREGHEVHVLTSHPRHSAHNLVSDSKDIPLHEKKEGVDIHRILGVKTLRCGRLDLGSIINNEIFWMNGFLSIAGFIMEEKPDVVHVLNVHSIPAAVAAAKIFRIPVVVTYNSLIRTCPKGDRLNPDNHFCDEPMAVTTCFNCIRKLGPVNGRRRMDRYRVLFPLGFLYEYLVCSLFGAFVKFADGVIAINVDMRKILLQNCASLSNLRLISVPLKIPDLADRRTIRRKYCLPEEEPIILFAAASFEPAKGSEQLIEAMPMVIDFLSNATFLVAGHVFSHEKELLKEKMMQDHVILTGYIPLEQVWEMFVASDVVVCLEQRGVSRVLLEAMEMGRPIIAPNLKGIREVIDNRKNGILIDSNSPTELATAIVDMILDKDSTRKLGESARKKMGTKSSEEAVAQKISKVYEELLRGRSRGKNK